MKILIGHNGYQSFGGEDAVALAEQEMLEDNGHKIITYSRSNKELSDLSVKEKTKFMWYLGWAEKSYKDITSLIKEHKPDVAHFHNIYFMMSPAVYHACKDQGVPVVQSLHNFRPLCANGLFFRNNQVCEDCLSGSLINGIMHRCYQKSFLITSLVTRMMASHRKMDTWKNKVDAYITATDFTRQKYIKAGFAAEKIHVKPNLLYPAPTQQAEDKGYALYVGRLSDEKGVDVLIHAWKDIKDLPLKIAGEGPSMAYLSGYKQNNGLDNVELLGHVEDSQYQLLMKGAKFIIVPSVCYENFPRIVAEAFAYGVPVIASQLGSLEQIIDEKRNGCLFDVGNSEQLAQKVNWMREKADLPAMKVEAYKKFTGEFSVDCNYKKLMTIYQRLLKTQ